MGDMSFRVDPYEATRSLFGIEDTMNWRRHFRNSQQAQTVQQAHEPLDAIQQPWQSAPQHLDWPPIPEFRHHAFQAARLHALGPPDQHMRSAQQQHDAILHPLNHARRCEQSTRQRYEAPQSLGQVPQPSQQRFGQIYAPLQTSQRSVRQPLDDDRLHIHPAHQRFGQAPQPLQPTLHFMPKPLGAAHQPIPLFQQHVGQTRQPLHGFQAAQQSIDTTRLSPECSHQPLPPAQQCFGQKHQLFQVAQQSVHPIRQSPDSLHRPIPPGQRQFGQTHQPFQAAQQSLDPIRQSPDSLHRPIPPGQHQFGQTHQPFQAAQLSLNPIRQSPDSLHRPTPPAQQQFGQTRPPFQNVQQSLGPIRQSLNSTRQPSPPAQQHFGQTHQPIPPARPLSVPSWSSRSSDSADQATTSAQQHSDPTRQPVPDSISQQVQPVYPVTATQSAEPTLPPQPTQTVDPLQSFSNIQHKAPKVAASKKRKRSEPKDTQDANPRPTKLRVSNPVRTRVPPCIWNNVFGWSHPNTLLTCRDMQYFRPLLVNHTVVWRDSRVNTYGNEIPDPLPGLTEEEYANLLSNRTGCQVAGCGDKLARKTYWAFCKRLCQAHMSTELVMHQDALNTIKERLGAAHVALALELLKCVTSGTRDSWKNYTKAGPATERFTTSIYHVTELKNAIEAFLATFPDLNTASVDEKKLYFKEKQKLAAEREEFALKVEKFEKEEARRVRDENARLKKERKEEFSLRAGEMVPPMAPEVLVLCPSYKKSLNIAKAPTTQSWSYLLEKLEKERGEAEAKHARNVQNMM